MMRIVIALLLTFVTFTVSANFDPKDMEGFDPANKGDLRVKFTSTDYPSTVAEHGGFVVINTTRSNKCPAGGYYLVNLVRKTYQFVDAGSCHPNLRTVLSTPVQDEHSVVTEILTFLHGNYITARYPLYSY